MSEELSDEASAAIAERVREALARKRLSRQALADLAKISLSTLEKALAGSRPFTLATTIRLEEALGSRLRGAASVSGTARESLGAYSHAGVSWLEGDYLTLRPSFEGGEALHAYRTEIAWDEAASCLVFREAARLDAEFAQVGQVSLSNQSGHIYLVTQAQGQYRLMILGRPAMNGDMYGVLTTLLAGPGSHLTPAASPIALVPLRRLEKPVFGKIAPGDAAYDDYRAIVAAVTAKGFAKVFS